MIRTLNKLLLKQAVKSLLYWNGHYELLDFFLVTDF